MVSHLQKQILSSNTAVIIAGCRRKSAGDVGVEHASPTQIRYAFLALQSWN
jgi:hypothetical protein